MFENVSTFSVHPKFYAPLLLLDRLPDCLGQQVVSVLRYGKRSKCYLHTPQSPPHHHYYCLSKHQTWTCTPWDCSVCLLCEVTLYNILILLRIEIGTLNLWMATDCSSFYNGRNHSHSVRMLFISWVDITNTSWICGIHPELSTCGAATPQQQWCNWLKCFMFKILSLWIVALAVIQL